MNKPALLDRRHVGLSRLIWGFFLLIGVHGEASVNVSSSGTVSSQTSIQASPPLPIVSGIETCPYRTINYITHTLPQKCLKTNWTGLANLTTAVASEPGVVTPTGVIGEPTTTVDAEVGEVINGTYSMNTTSEYDSATGTASPTDSIEPQPTATETVAAESDADSPLDNAKFLSFEEWKKQNLEKAAQALEGQGQPNPNPAGSLADALEDSQMNIGFEGFGAARTAEPVAQTPTAAGSGDEKPIPVGVRKKEAGTTSKERFNYASVDCAANILKTNPKCKSPSSILVENKDSYMLNECSIDNKFLIIELCNDILVDTVVLANFEFFSSMFRTFRVSVSDRYPVKLENWKELGVFEARNTRDIQAFAIVNPQAFVRYLRVEFLSQYGSEHYCPVSLLRIHGTTMIEDLRNPEDSRHEEDLEEVQVEVTAASSPVASAVSTSQVETNTHKPEPEKNVEQTAVVASNTSSESPAVDSSIPETVQTTLVPTVEASQTTTGPSISTSSVVTMSTEMSASTNLSTVDVVLTSTIVVNISAISNSESSQTSTTVVAQIDSERKETSTASVDNSTQSKESPSSSGAISISSSSISSSSSSSSSSSTTTSISTTTVAKVNVPPESVRPSPPSSAPPAPSPTTQENIFKSIQKRLQMLETNSTLSLQYIEEQSRILRDAFTIVEKRQMGKTEDFLRHLNDSVVAELKIFRQQYDQLWQSTVLELEAHREQYQRELIAVTARLTIVADELLFQKRMAIVQSTLVMLCIGLVLFVRSGSSTLELPLMQQVLSKSHSVLGLQFDSFPASPASKEGSPQRPTASTMTRRLSHEHRLSRSRSEEFGEDGSLDEDAQMIEVVEQDLLLTPSTSSPSQSLQTGDENENTDGNEAILTPTPTPSKPPPILEDIDESPTFSKNETDGLTSSPSTASLSSSAGVSERVSALKKRAGGEHYTRSFSGPATPRGSRDMPEPQLADVEWDTDRSSREQSTESTVVEPGEYSDTRDGEWEERKGTKILE